MAFDNVDPISGTDTTVQSHDPASSDPSVQQPTTQAAPNAGAINQPPTSEPSWLKGRLDEARRTAVATREREWQQRETQMQAQYEAVQRQLHALVGVTPQENPEVAAIRAQFQKLFPGLAQLEQKSQDVMGLVERSGDLTSQTQHYWTSYGRQMMDRLYSKATESLGGNLSEGAKRQLHSAFSGYVAGSPEMTARYTQDPSIVDEFWRDFQAGFIDPVRRTSQATVQQQTSQRMLPQDSPSGAPQASPAPHPQSIDERAAIAWNSWTNRGQQ